MSLLVARADVRALPLAAASVDAIVCDPPYDLTAGKKGGTGEAPVNLDSPYGRARITTGFMGKEWDGTGVAFEPATWREALRVLKPGGHLVAFGGSRTYHRLTCAIEDAGFEIRDCLMWLYGSGFPKSLDVSKAIDKAAGAERGERLAPKPGHENFVGRDNMRSLRESGALSGEGGFSRPWMADPEQVEDAHWDFAPATEAARQWDGWGTALKPAFEPIVLARKPLIGTVAQNVLAHGTGALNIDGTRIGTEGGTAGAGAGAVVFADGLNGTFGKVVPGLGRWPANVLLDEDSAALLDQITGEVGGGFGTRGPQRDNLGYGFGAGGEVGYGDSGGASRFFYTAKASRGEREAGLEGFMPRTPGQLTDRTDGAAGTKHPRAGAGREQGGEWVNEVLRAALQGDMARFLQGVTDGFSTVDGSAWSTTLSGSESADPSPRDSKSTTSTATSSTTASSTSSPSIQSRINAFTRAALLRMESGLSPADFAESVSRLMDLTGTSAEKAGRSTDDAASAISESLFALSKNGGPGRVGRRNLHPT